MVRSSDIRHDRRSANPHRHPGRIGDENVAHLIQFVNDRLARLRVFQKQMSTNRPAPPGLIELIRGTYHVLASPSVMRFALDHETVTGFVIEWLSMTGRQPPLWRERFNELPRDVQARFVRQLLYECGRLTPFLLKWIDKELLSGVAQEVFEEFIGRKKGLPVILPPIYLARIKAVDPDFRRRLPQYYDAYLRLVDRNLAVIAHHLKIIPRHRRSGKKSEIGMAQAVQRIRAPITRLNTAYLTAVPTATLASLYAVNEPEDRMAIIRTVRTFQKGMHSKKERFLDTLTIPNYYDIYKEDVTRNK